MKRIALLAAIAGLATFPATAGSIEVLDATITGPAGPTKSMIVLGPTELCAPNCGDGVENIVTSSFGDAAKPGRKTINMAFARKFPDPAVPIPAVSADSSASDSGIPGFGGSTPVATPPAAAAAPSAPADAGAIPAQPPVAESSLRQSGTGEMLREPGVPKGAEEAAMRGAVNTGSHKIGG
jgi:hypothetical protein